VIIIHLKIMGGKRTGGGNLCLSGAERRRGENHRRNFQTLGTRGIKSDTERKTRGMILTNIPGRGEKAGKGAQKNFTYERS